MRSASSLDAVTVDGFGTLLHLSDPAPRLQQALAREGIRRSMTSVARAFRAEAAYYRPRSLQGRDPASLAALREECVTVFLEHLEAPVAPGAFVDPFIDALVFELVPGAAETLERLSAAGVELACISNWDVSLHEHLEHLGVARWFRVVLPSAAAGVEKPDPVIFQIALERLGVPPERALHVGDEDADRAGAEAAGLLFEPAPLATVPDRIGI